jgi:hypothetical protein
MRHLVAKLDAGRLTTHPYLAIGITTERWMLVVAPVIALKQIFSVDFLIAAYFLLKSI